MSCPSCKRNIIHLQLYEKEQKASGPRGIYLPVRLISESLMRPKSINRPPISQEVPVIYANDYKEACLVLADSPKASAALSRRCLQSIIRDKLNIQKRDLNLEIQEVIDGGFLPADLLESLDAVRNIGNFSAHPIKSKTTGEIVEVEPHEAEWNLDVIELLFDFLFDRPALIKKKKEALNAKLSDAGKPQLK